MRVPRISTSNCVHAWLQDLWFEGLRHYRLTSGNVRLSPGWGLGPVNRAQAAHTTLTQLRALEMTGDAAVHMSEWVWTPQLAQVCSTTLPDRKFDVTIDTLTDEQLTAIMHFGPNLRKVSVRGAVALRLDHSHVAWPWPEAGLHVGGKRVGIDVGQAVRLPRMPLGSLSGKEILLTTKVIKEVSLSVCNTNTKNTRLSRRDHQVATSMVSYADCMPRVQAYTLHALLVWCRLQAPNRVQPPRCTFARTD